MINDLIGIMFHPSSASSPGDTIVPQVLTGNETHNENESGADNEFARRSPVFVPVYDPNYDKLSVALSNTSIEER